MSEMMTEGGGRRKNVGRAALPGSRVLRDNIFGYPGERRIADLRRGCFIRTRSSTCWCANEQGAVPR